MISRFRVPLGYAAGVLVLALARPSLRSLAVGLPLAFSGEAVRLWASGHIEKSRALATGGPYAYTRNPLYLGSVVMGLGLALAAASPAVAVLSLGYLLAFYPAAVRGEAAFLKARFEGEYGAWAREVPLFLPRLTPGGPRASRFAWARVRDNREWRTAAAVPFVAALLWLRGVLF